MKWSPWITVLAGIWLVAAPFATGYSTISNVATTEAIALGVVIAALGLWTAGTGVPAYIDYLLMVCGGWSIVAPFVVVWRHNDRAEQRRDRRNRRRRHRRASRRVGVAWRATELTA